MFQYPLLLQGKFRLVMAGTVCVQYIVCTVLAVIHTKTIKPTHNYMYMYVIVPRYSFYKNNGKDNSINNCADGMYMN